MPTCSRLIALHISLYTINKSSNSTLLINPSIFTMPEPLQNSIILVKFIKAKSYATTIFLYHFTQIPYFYVERMPLGPMFAGPLAPGVIVLIPEYSFFKAAVTI